MPLGIIHLESKNFKVGDFVAVHFRCVWRRGQIKDVLNAHEVMAVVTLLDQPQSIQVPLPTLRKLDDRFVDDKTSFGLKDKDVEVIEIEDDEDVDVIEVEDEDEIEVIDLEDEEQDGAGEDEKETRKAAPVRVVKYGKSIFLVDEQHKFINKFQFLSKLRKSRRESFLRKFRATSVYKSILESEEMAFDRHQNPAQRLAAVLRVHARTSQWMQKNNIIFT